MDERRQGGIIPKQNTLERLPRAATQVVRKRTSGCVIFVEERSVRWSVKQFADFAVQLALPFLGAKVNVCQKPKEVSDDDMANPVNGGLQ